MLNCTIEGCRPVLNQAQSSVSYWWSPTSVLCHRYAVGCSEGKVKVGVVYERVIYPHVQSLGASDDNAQLT